jgi:hypothetical protein
MIIDKLRKTASRCVIVLEHPISWSSEEDIHSDLSDRIPSTGNRLRRGCWFLLPGFTVFAADPSQEFFACVDRCGRRWRSEIKLCTFHKALGRILRKAERLHWDVGFSVAPDNEPDSSSALRRHTLPGGLFIDGCLVSTRTGRTTVMRIHDDDELTVITVRRRVIDLREIHAAENHDLLARIARVEIEDGVRRNPQGALFVNPQFSVEAPTDSPTFYAVAVPRQLSWSNSMRRVFGDRSLDKSQYCVSPASNAMINRGVLHVAGRFYELGAGPNRPPDPQAGKRTLASSREISAEFLRLKTPDPKERPGASDSGLDAERAGKASVNGEHRNGLAH